MGKETSDAPSKPVDDPNWQRPDKSPEERRARHAREGLQAMADYRAAEAALRDRTKKLRAMREAQESNSSPLSEGASSGPAKKVVRRRQAT